MGMTEIYRAAIMAAIKAQIEGYKREKRQCKRYSPGWTRADAAATALQDLLKSIRSF